MAATVVTTMLKTNDLLVKSELQDNPYLNGDVRDKIQLTMTRYEAEVVAPLIILGQVAGFILLGPKINRKPFYTNDTSKVLEIASETARSLRYALSTSRFASETKRWAHSLNQDLKPLTSAFHFLREEYHGGDKDIVEVFNEIQTPLKHLSSFLNFLTHQARIIDEALRNKYELKPVDLNEILNMSLKRQNSLIKSKAISVTNALNQGSEVIYGHQNDLIIALDSILSNALRYVPEGGFIKIDGKKIDDQFLISIENNGPIIPDEHIDDIFTEGFQVKDGRQGTAGLGLPNVKRIISMHSGDVCAKNTGADLGVRFILKLPVSKSLKGEGGYIWKPSNIKF